MAKKFDVNNVDLTIIEEIENRVVDIEGKAEYNLRQINLSEIQINDKNKFGMRNIEELSESLKKYGQLHNVVVRKVENEDSIKYLKPYVLISGERRFRAAQALEWKTLACKIVECDEVDEEILLITANLDTRELNDIERSENAQRLVELITAKRKTGESFQGKKTREVVAEKMGVAPATIQKLVGLKNLIPEFKRMVENKEIGLELANQYAQMEYETQKTVYVAIQDGLKLTAKTAKELKDKLKKTEEDSEALILNMKNELKEKEEILRTHKENVERKQELILKLNKDIEKTKLNKDKESLDLEIVADNIRKELEKEIATKDEINQEKVNSLQKELERANKDIFKSNEDSEKKIINLNNKVKELERKQGENINVSEIEGNMEIWILAKEIGKLLSSLSAKISNLKHDNFKFNEESRKSIDYILKQIECIK